MRIKSQEFKASKRVIKKRQDSVSFYDTVFFYYIYLVSMWNSLDGSSFLPSSFLLSGPAAALDGLLREGNDFRHLPPSPILLKPRVILV